MEQRKKHRIKIFGERNSGTNYLSKLVDLNFNTLLLAGAVPSNFDRLVSKTPIEEYLKDVYFKFTNRSNLGWKHREVDNIPEILFHKNTSSHSLSFLTITKNPYAWLLSLYRRPYHYNEDKTVSFLEFLNTPWETIGRETTRETYENPVVMWNTKTQSHINLRKKFDAYLVKYEELILHTEKELESIKDTFDLPQKSSYPTNYTASTKDKNKTAEYYRDYYGNQRWMEKLKQDHVKLINKWLDKDLLDYFEYEKIKPLDVN